VLALTIQKESIMAQRANLEEVSQPLHDAYACLLANGLDGAGEALRILVNEASRIERAQHLQAMPYERSAQRVDQANGYKSKTMLTRMGEITFEVPQVRTAGFYPSALERGSRSEQSVNLALAEMYVQGVSTRKVIEVLQKAGRARGHAYDQRTGVAQQGNQTYNTRCHFVSQQRHFPTSYFGHLGRAR
jgi:transposase-like protein